MKKVVIATGSMRAQMPTTAKALTTAAESMMTSRQKRIVAMNTRRTSSSSWNATSARPISRASVGVSRPLAGSTATVTAKEATGQDQRPELQTGPDGPVPPIQDHQGVPDHPTRHRRGQDDDAEAQTQQA